RKAEDWILSNLGLDYHWPGNMRQLEQIVRNIRVRRAYAPSAKVYVSSAPGATAGAAEPADRRAANLRVPLPAGGANGDHSGNDGAGHFLAGVRDGTLNADELLQGYCARVQT